MHPYLTLVLTVIYYSHSMLNNDQWRRNCSVSGRAPLIFDPPPPSLYQKVFCACWKSSSVSLKIGAPHRKHLPTLLGIWERGLVYRGITRDCLYRGVYEHVYGNLWFVHAIDCNVKIPSLQTINFP